MLLLLLHVNVAAIYKIINVAVNVTVCNSVLLLLCKINVVCKCCCHCVFKSVSPLLPMVQFQECDSTGLQGLTYK